MIKNQDSFKPFEDLIFISISPDYSNHHYDNTYIISVNFDLITYTITNYIFYSPLLAIINYSPFHYTSISPSIIYQQHPITQEGLYENIMIHSSADKVNS